MRARLARFLAVAALLGAVAPAARADLPWNDRPQALVGGEPGPGAGAAAAGSGAVLRFEEAGMEESLGAGVSSGGGELMWDLGKTLLALTLICGLGYLGLRLGLRRLGEKRGLGRRRFRIVDRFGLEPKKTLYIMEICGRTMLLGTSESGIRYLTGLDGETAGGGGAARESQARSAPDGAAAEFYEILQKKLDRPAVEGASSSVLRSASGPIQGEFS